MKYCKDLYEMLFQGYPPEDNESFSATMKRDMKNNRMHQFLEVIDYLEKENIPYEQIEGSFDIEVKDFVLQSNMKVKFDGNTKFYQYNYNKVIERINK